MKLRNILLAVILSIIGFTASNASTNNQHVYSPAFSSDVQFADVLPLTEKEMDETIGDYWEYRYRGSRFGLRVAYDGPHHRFPVIGHRSHLQLNVWRTGVSGSGSVWRLPLW